MINFKDKDVLLLSLIFIIQYLCIFMFFNSSNTVCSKIILLVSLFFSLYRFNYKIVLINTIYILLLIIIFYKQCEKDELYTTNDNTTIESFTSKLKLLKDKSKNNSSESNLNSSKFKNKKIKEQFNADDDPESFDNYRNDFKSYKFTRKVNSSMDALNKLPLYIEKFKELW